MLSVDNSYSTDSTTDLIMSDARAKAEARRAKILARDSSKKVQAIGDDVSPYRA